MLRKVECVKFCAIFSRDFFRTCARLLAPASLCIFVAGCNPDSDTYERNESRFSVSSANMGNAAPQSVNRKSKTALLPKSQMRPPVSATGLKASKGKSENPLKLASFEGVTTGSLNSANTEKPIRQLTAGRAEKLTKFYSELASLEAGARKKPITILHLGDDHIAFDRFSGVLRQRLQGKFGDAGRGLVMPGYPFPYYRARGLRFARTGTWTASNATKPGDKGPFGLSGVALTSTEPQATISLTAQNGPFAWAEIEFLAGANQGKAVVTVDGAGKVARQIVLPDASSAGIKRVRIEQPGTRLTIQAGGGGPVTVLSWSIGKAKPGIRYVNLGVPGASITSLARVNTKIVADELANLQPDLIVLSYGAQDSLNDNLNVEEFSARFSALMDGLKSLAPKASFLIIGPADSARLPQFSTNRSNSPATTACRSLSNEERENYARLKAQQDKRLSRWHSPLKLQTVRQTLQQVSLQQGAHYWDWSKMMGGSCGIHAWVHANPPLAAKDHTHLTEAGAKKSANQFFTELMTGFASYKRSAAATLKKQAPKRRVATRKKKK